MIWIVLSILFLFQVTLIFWFSRYIGIRRNRIAKRVSEIEKKEWQETEEYIHKTKATSSKNIFSTSLWRIFSQFKTIRLLEERLQNEIKKANILMKSNELIMFMFLSGLLGGIIGIILVGGSIERGGWIGLFSWMIPLIWLNAKKNKRKAKLDAQLFDLVSMTANSLKAGYSLIQSLELLSREMAQPMAEEIQRMLQEMRLGVTTEQALINFNQRIGSKDLDLIITSMLIQRQVGGNLAEVLITIGDTIRERVRIHGEIKSLTAQGRMSMMIFIILPIGLGALLMITNPDYMMTLFIHPLGWLLTAIAIIGQLVGAIIINKIIRIEV